MQTKSQNTSIKTKSYSTPGISIFLQKELSRTDFKTFTSNLKVPNIPYIKSLHDNKHQPAGDKISCGKIFRDSGSLSSKQNNNKTKQQQQQQYI